MRLLARNRCLLTQGRVRCRMTAVLSLGYRAITTMRLLTLAYSMRWLLSRVIPESTSNSLLRGAAIRLDRLRLLPIVFVIILECVTLIVRCVI